MNITKKNKWIWYKVASLLPLNLNKAAQLEVIIENTTVREYKKAMTRVHETE
jgi:hypothetical protein